MHVTLPKPTEAPSPKRAACKRLGGRGGHGRSSFCNKMLKHEELKRKEGVGDGVEKYREREKREWWRGFGEGWGRMGRRREFTLFFFH